MTSKNIYTHVVDSYKINIKNSTRDKFRVAIEGLPYKGYEVESLKDGRKIIITKPGSKFSYGIIKREDYMVWIQNSSENTMWLVSFKNIWDDMREKTIDYPGYTLHLIDSIERVYNGEDPDDFINEVQDSPCGETTEFYLKFFKWLFGEEDCNYPTREGRDRSMKSFRVHKQWIIARPDKDVRIKEYDD